MHAYWCAHQSRWCEHHVRRLRPGQSPRTGDCPSPVSDPGCRVALSGSADTTPEPSGPQQPARAGDSRPGAAARRSGAPSRGVIWGVRVLLHDRDHPDGGGSLRDLGQPPGARLQQLVEDEHRTAPEQRDPDPDGRILRPAAIRERGRQRRAVKRASASSEAPGRSCCRRPGEPRREGGFHLPRAAAGAERVEHGEPADRTAVHQHRRGQLEGRKAHRQRGLHRPAAGPRSADTTLSACRPRCWRSCRRAPPG